MYEKSPSFMISISYHYLVGLAEPSHIIQKLTHGSIFTAYFIKSSLSRSDLPFMLSWANEPWTPGPHIVHSTLPPSVRTLR